MVQTLVCIVIVHSTFPSHVARSGKTKTLFCYPQFPHDKLQRARRYCFQFFRPYFLDDRQSRKHVSLSCFLKISRRRNIGSTTKCALAVLLCWCFLPFLAKILNKIMFLPERFQRRSRQTWRRQAVMFTLWITLCLICSSYFLMFHRINLLISGTIYIYPRSNFGKHPLWHERSVFYRSRDRN